VGLLKYALYEKSNFLKPKSLALGNHGDVVISNKPWPEEMHAIKSCQIDQSSKIALLPLVKFFQWRFNNKKHRYLFCYHKKNDTVLAYLVARLSPSNRRLFIVDFAERANNGVRAILQTIIQNKHFDILSVYSYSLDERFSSLLKELHFKPRPLLRKIHSRKTDVYPLLVKPITQVCTQRDWFVDNLDIRLFTNWDIKEICSDGS